MFFFLMWSSNTSKLIAGKKYKTKDPFLSLLDFIITKVQPKKWWKQAVIFKYANVVGDKHIIPLIFYHFAFQILKNHAGNVINLHIVSFILNNHIRPQTQKL